MVQLTADRVRISVRHRQLDYELRAHRFVLFHADRAVVVLHDAADDGQAQAGAAFSWWRSREGRVSPSVRG